MHLKLTERDMAIMREITRWRFLLARQIKILCGFSSQRACDRRVKKLIEAGYIERKYLIVGIPRLYMVTRKAVQTFGLPYYTPNIRIEQVRHDIAVIDTATYLIYNKGIDSTSLTTERDLKHRAGFGSTKHYPDFVYTNDDTNFSVEVELNVKKLSTLERNIKNNFKTYDVQQWFIPNDQPKITENVKSVGKKYGGIEIIPLERVIEYVRNI